MPAGQWWLKQRNKIMKYKTPTQIQFKSHCYKRKCLRYFYLFQKQRKSVAAVARLCTKGESLYFMAWMKWCSKWWMCSDLSSHFPQRGFSQPNLALTILLQDTKLFLIVFFSCHVPLPAIAHFWYWYLASLLSNDVDVKTNHLSKLPMNELGEGAR